MASLTLKNLIQNKAYKMVLLQLLGVGLIAFFALILGGLNTGLSVLLGGLAYGLPNLFFVWQVFRYVGASQTVQFLTAFILGEMVKLILSAILFLVIVKYLPVSLLSVLIGFIGAIVSFWIVCFLLFTKNNNSVNSFNQKVRGE